MYLAPFGRSDAFWDNSASYFNNLDFYEGLVLGIQADPTFTTSTCAKSFETTTNMFKSLVAYDITAYKANYLASGTTVNTIYGYYPVLFKKYQDSALAAFDFFL